MRIALSIMPVAVLVAALTWLRLPAWCAALAAFVVGVAEAVFAFALPVGEIAGCTVKGAATGLFPIGLVIVSALFTYAIIVESDAIAEIKGGLSRLSNDRRFQALLVAWGFGNFMEGMAGFGTAVAIPCAILVGIGFDPVKAVLCCLVANTTPTAFGSVGVPTMVLASETGLDLSRLTTTIAILQLAATSLSPFLMLAIVDGWRGVRECWRLALVADVAFLASWLLVAPFMGCELPNIVGGMLTMAVFAAMGSREGIDLRRQMWAWRPFAFVVLALGCGALLPQDRKISPGFIILAAAALGGLSQGLRPAKLLSLAWRTVSRYSTALLTICEVLALAKVMGASGMTQTLADGLIAATGAGYPAVSGVVGALGGFVTGSGTSSNVLFGALQASVGSGEAQKTLFAAANVMGAGIGKMVCPQSLVLGCAAAGLAGRERDVMVKVLGCFVLVLAVACLSVFVGNTLIH
jgi:lactate permease